MCEGEWLVDPASVGRDRASTLLAPALFEEILHRIKGRDTAPRARREHGDPGGRFDGACRYKWSVTPRDKIALDLFFNGAYGYRAAYSVSPLRGDEANRSALTNLSTWLRDPSGAVVGDSLLSPSLTGGKLWIPEDERINCALITGRIHKPEVLQPKWMRAAEAQLAVPRVGGDYRFLAAAGILAPQPRFLRVIGAWMRDGQVVKPVKPRSSQIHEHGYT